MARLGEEIEEFLARKRRKSAPTQEQYRFILERVLLPWCEANGVEDAGGMTTLPMEAFIASLESRSRPLSIPTIRTYIRTVRIFLKWAKVPPGDYEVPREPERVRDVLTRREIQQLERAGTTERDRLIVRVLADCGIRNGELVGLRSRDLHMDKSAGVCFITVIGKGDRQREVGVPPETFHRLRRLADSEPVRSHIFWGNGMPLTTHGVQDVMRRLATTSKLGRRIWPHLLRHSWITQQVRSGKMSLVEIQRTVGHRSLAMISQVYTHTTAADSYASMLAGLKG